MRTALILLLVVGTTLAGSARASTRAPLDCGRALVRVRNGNQLFVPGRGPRCLARAFAAGCRAATFAVTLRGVDTSASLRFTVGGRKPCRIVVAGRNQVFGANRVTAWGERCDDVASRTEGVAVTRCRGRAGDFLLSPPDAPNVPGSRY